MIFGKIFKEWIIPIKIRYCKNFWRQTVFFKLAKLYKRQIAIINNGIKGENFTNIFINNLKEIRNIDEPLSEDDTLLLKKSSDINETIKKEK